jgi:hypothetical protein
VGVNVTGSSNLDSMVLTQTPDLTTPGLNRVSGATLTFNSSTPQGATVTATITGTPGGVGTATGFYCSAVDGSHQSACVVGTDASTPTADYYTGVTAVTIGVS